jgi:hypothetical protein
MKIGISLLILCFFSGCCATPQTPEYRKQYAYYKNHHPEITRPTRSDYFLILLVNARHLDYSNGRALLKTLAKHPSDGSKNSDVGHAWFLVHGCINGKCVVVEGGHSGEAGCRQPRYFEGIINNIEYGCSSPAPEQKLCPSYEPNPVKYLWETRDDGFFQKGSGGHCPTYAIKVNLSQEQFKEIICFIDPNNYEYTNYAITGSQCSSYVADIARIAGLELFCEKDIPIPRKLRVCGAQYILWEDPCYSTLHISSPDILEKSMMQAVDEGKAEYALPFYLKKIKKRKCTRCHWKDLKEVISCFPERYQRAKFFK